MGNDGLEVLDADPNVELLLHGNVFEVQAVNTYGRLERLSEDFYSPLLMCRESCRSITHHFRS